MAPESEPTPWELHRADQKILEVLARIESRMLTTDRFEEYARGVDRRLDELERDQQEWTVESRGEHVRLDGKIEQVREALSGKVDNLRVDLTAQLDGYREKQSGMERAQREARTRTWLAIGVAVLSALLSFGGAVILRSVGG